MREFDSESPHYLWPFGWAREIQRIGRASALINFMHFSGFQHRPQLILIFLLFLIFLIFLITSITTLRHFGISKFRGGDGCGVGISRSFMWDMFECSETHCSKPLAGGGHSRIGGGGDPRAHGPHPVAMGPRGCMGGAGHQSEILVPKVATMSSSGTQIGKVVARSAHIVEIARQVR